MIGETSLGGVCPHAYKEIFINGKRPKEMKMDEVNEGVRSNMIPERPVLVRQLFGGLENYPQHQHLRKPVELSKKARENQNRNSRDNEAIKKRSKMVTINIVP